MNRVKRRQVLLDSDGVIAVIHSEHSSHRQAIAAQKRLDKEEAVWYISRYVIAETATVISQRLSHTEAVKFLEELNESGDMHVIETSSELELETREIFKGQTSKNISYVDCHNMAIVRRYKLDGIFSFDKHYQKNGIKLATQV